jgi:hypothetical protein
MADIEIDFTDQLTLVVQPPDETPIELGTNVISPTVTIDLTAAPGQQSLDNTWTYLVAQWDNPPSLVATIAAGQVYLYTLNSTPRYRLVPAPYDAGSDAFYSGFSSGVLSGLIDTRGA